jgi:DNA-binding NtrC family response regulator
MNVVKPKVLIIEDDESTRHLLEMFLQKLPIKPDVLCADSADEGKRLLGLNRVDLVICDFHMGDGFGTEVLEHLRDIKSEVPFVLYTSEEFSRIPHISYLKFTYIQKPEVDSLMDEITRQLQK